MSTSRLLMISLALGGILLPTGKSARAQGVDHALLAAFCNPADIAGTTCKRAKGYPNAGGRACDVKLGADRYSGKFTASEKPVLVVAYESGCEPHATDSGGAVLFELSGDKYVFKNYHPGSEANDCIVVKDARQDLLICLTGHMGQGILESGVAQMVFTRDAGGEIGLSPDFLLRAEDSIGANGANTVTCKDQTKYFGVSKLSAGPRPKTVAVKLGYADAATIKTACGKGFPRPKKIFGKLARGEAYVPEGKEKSGIFVIDLVTRKVEAEAQGGKPGASK